MEPRGAIACVTALFESGIAYVFEVVGNDDSSVQANLRHSFDALVKAGIINKKTQWPKRMANTWMTMVDCHCMCLPLVIS